MRYTRPSPQPQTTHESIASSTATITAVDAGGNDLGMSNRRCVAISGPPPTGNAERSKTSKLVSVPNQIHRPSRLKPTQWTFSTDSCGAFGHELSQDPIGGCTPRAAINPSDRVPTGRCLVGANSTDVQVTASSLSKLCVRSIAQFVRLEQAKTHWNQKQEGFDLVRRPKNVFRPEAISIPMTSCSSA